MKDVRGPSRLLARLAIPKSRLVSKIVPYSFIAITLQLDNRLASLPVTAFYVDESTVLDIP